MVRIVALRTLALGDQGPLRSLISLPLALIVVAASMATMTASNVSEGFLGLIRHTEISACPP
jgi:hypothetical protein